MASERQMWKFTSPTVIQHESGFSLELQGGSWHEPMGLNPIATPEMNVQDTAKLIREGMLFAMKNSAASASGYRMSDSGTSRKQTAMPRPKRPATGRTLSLRKKTSA